MFGCSPHFLFSLNTIICVLFISFLCFPFLVHRIYGKFSVSLLFLRFFVFDDYYNYHLTKWDVSRRQVD